MGREIERMDSDTGGSRLMENGLEECFVRPFLALELGLKTVYACTFAVLLKVHIE